MAQLTSPSETPQTATSREPGIIRGADDQAAAYEAWLAQWESVDAEEDDSAWRRIQQGLQETRHEMGQRLLFPE